MPVRVLAATLAFALGCDAAPAPQAAPAKSEAAPTPAAPKPAPLAPAPEGATILGGAYVQTCASAGACPSLLQPAGAAHCKALTTGGMSWRLPTRDELKSWRGKPELVGFEGFHWSGTPFEDAPGQVWIFDPTSGSETTIPGDRKPFVVRCVAKP